jgi:hypothetical protein
VNGQIDEDPFARSGQSIVSRYDHESVSVTEQGTITDISRRKNGSTADQRGPQSDRDDLEEDVFSRDDESGTAANSERTAYRGGSGQWEV